MQWKERFANYGRITKFPRSLFAAEDYRLFVVEGGRVVEIGIISNDYRAKPAYCGGRPAGYLHHIRSWFPDKKRVLHLRRGKVDLQELPGDTVDINPELAPSYVEDAQRLEAVPLVEYDLVLADLPYTEEDAEYCRAATSRRNVILSTLQCLSPGAHVVWLDQVPPMYQMGAFDVEAMIGVAHSTNDEFRVITIYRRNSAVPSESSANGQLLKCACGNPTCGGLPYRLVRNDLSSRELAYSMDFHHVADHAIRTVLESNPTTLPPCLIHAAAIETLACADYDMLDEKIYNADERLEIAEEAAAESDPVKTHRLLRHFWSI